MATDTLYLDRLPSPLGHCLVVHDDAGRLRALDWEDFEPRLRTLLARCWGSRGHGPELVRRAAPDLMGGAVTGYFAGDVRALDRLAVLTNGTAFQQEVWQALRGIPAGQTLSYGALADRIGRPSAVRAIGLAVGANPISLVLPCHRVIGANGSLTGYAGGLARKRWLLAHEGALPAA